MRRLPVAARAALATAAILLVGGCSAGSSDGASDGDAAPVPSPSGDACTVLSADPADGVYTVGDAGTVTVRHDGDRLVLDGVQAAEGWTSEVTGQSDTEVEVELVSPGQEIDFDVEIEDGVVEAEYCTDGD
jgi:hypothetical protein